MQLILSVSFVAVILCITTNAQANNSRALVVSLDVPDDRSPDLLCVITREGCRPGFRCRTWELSDLPLQQVDKSSIYEIIPPSSKLKILLPKLDILLPKLDILLPKLEIPLSKLEILLLKLKFLPLKSKIPHPDADVLSGIMMDYHAKGDQLACASEFHKSCRPQIDLRQFPETRGKRSGRVVCGLRPGTEVASSDSRGASASSPGEPDQRGPLNRVAFIGLTFSDPRQASGIQTS